jgi:error-prone DNA polymerase
MTPIERLEADYGAMELTTGTHPMGYARKDLPMVWRAIDLQHARHGLLLTIGGQVICRQRPGTAKGNVFVSLEDETGISNVFVPSATFEAYRLVITQEPFLLIHGRMQHVDGVTSVMALKIEALRFDACVHAESHDFH